MVKFKINNTVAYFDEETYNLKINSKTLTPNIRTYKEMKSLYFEDDSNLKENDALYLMYRGVYLSEQDKNLFEKYNLRYDITVILPKIIWKEYNKTFWHYHPKASNGAFYEELYQVLHWKAIYLQQNNEKIFYTLANKSDVVLMKSWFWHVTINPSKNELLMMANIVSWNFSSIYDEYKEKKWAMYYFTTNNTWVKNKNYSQDINLVEINDFFSVNSDLYWDFLQSPEKFKFLSPGS